MELNKILHCVTTVYLFNVLPNTVHGQFNPQLYFQFFSSCDLNYLYIISVSSVEKLNKLSHHQHDWYNIQ